MTKTVFGLIGVLLLSSNLAGAHNNSISFSEITITPTHIRYDLRTILSEFLTHAVAADDNGDEKLDDAELQNHKQDIYSYLDKRIKVQGPGSAYLLKVDSITVSESGMPSITFHLTFTPKNQRVRSFTISCKIFEDVENHRSLAKIISGEEVQQFVFTLNNQYERNVTGEDAGSSVDEAPWAQKTLLGLFLLMVLAALLWLVRRTFLTRPSL